MASRDERATRSCAVEDARDCRIMQRARWVAHGCQAMRVDRKLLGSQRGLIGETRDREDARERTVDSHTFEDTDGVAGSRGKSNV